MQAVFRHACPAGVRKAARPSSLDRGGGSEAAGRQAVGGGGSVAAGRQAVGGGGSEAAGRQAVGGGGSEAAVRRSPALTREDGLAHQ